MHSKFLSGVTFMITLAAVASVSAAEDAEVLARHYLLSDDTGVVNVKHKPFNAAGDGRTDDTAAIRAAIKFALEKGNRYSTPPFVFFPNGTYLVTAPLESKVDDHGWSGGWRAGMLLLGETRDGSVIKLADRAEAYSDPDAPRAVIATGSESDKRTQPGDEPLHGGGNRAFRHSVVNLTVDIGTGNPGAVGIDYVANNRGTIEAVTIRSSDPDRLGHTGLKMTRNWPGPCLIKDVLIEGFDRGIDVSHYEYGNTFEHVTLRCQREAGLVNRQNMLTLHDLTSENIVPAIRATDGNGLVVIIGGRFTGGAAETAAVHGVGELYLRDITVEGYGQAVDIENRKGAANLPNANGTTHIDLYTTERFALGAKGAEPLGLPIKPKPLFWTTDHDQWISPQKFLSDPEKVPDDWTDALQAAMDAGRPVVYLPNGSYRISRTIQIPSHVRLIIGFQSSITPGKENKDKVDPLLRFVGRGGQGTTLEHVWIDGHIEHAADRPVAFRHADLHGRYRNTVTGSGDLFLEDTIGPKPLLIEHPQQVFARQLNIEFGEEPLIENHGGTLWLLGYKTEGQMVCLLQTAGRTELLGGLFYPLRKIEDSTPALFITGGEVAATFAMSGPRYPVPVRSQVRDGQQSLTSKQVGGRSAALVRIQAGPSIVVARDLLDNVPPVDGSIPFWYGKTPGESPAAFADASGHRWSVVAVGGTHDIERPENWRPMRWNAIAQRWEGASLADQAPSYSKDRVLRSRPAGGKVVGLVFQPKQPGTFALTGKAQIDTWLPDGPATVVIQIVKADGTTLQLLRRDFADRTVIDWSKLNGLDQIQLQESDRLMISFAATRAQTGSLRLVIDDAPTAITATTP